MKVIKILVLVMGLCLLFSNFVWTQALMVKIDATDGVYSDYILVGADPASTAAIDSTLAPPLKEWELPPPTPGFDVRCATWPGWDDLLGGAKVNYHKMVSPGQTDEYLIQFQNDEGAGPVKFSWPGGLSALGGGYWRLFETDGTPLCDMTLVNEYTYHTADNLPQYILLRKGDAKGFATCVVESLATSKDEKGKSWKIVDLKRKAWGSTGCFTFTNNTGGDVNDLHVEFSQALVPEHLSFAPFTTAVNDDTPKLKKWTFKGATVGNGETVTICAWGNAGKQLVASAWWWTLDNVMTGTKGPKVFPNPGSEQMRLPMPNWINVFQELYYEKYPLTKGAANGKAIPPEYGLTAGVTYQLGLSDAGKPMYKYVYNPKYTDAVKTVFDKTFLHTSMPVPPCLDKDASLKQIYKAYKSYSPKKYQNQLVAELIMLDFNIQMSAYGHTSTGFGNLKFTTNPLVKDMSLCSLKVVADRFLSCAPKPSDPTLSGTDLLSVLQYANSAFSGARDSQEFAQTPIPGTPYFKTIWKDVKMLIDVPGLYRPTLSSPEPIVGQGFIYDETPLSFDLKQNYPNPFNPTTTIAFDLSEDAFVTVKIYNMLGQEIMTLADREEFYEGTNEIEFDASHLASGVYYYRLNVNDGQYQQVKKMMLLK